MYGPTPSHECGVLGDELRMSTNEKIACFRYGARFTRPSRRQRGWQRKPRVAVEGRSCQIASDPTGGQERLPFVREACLEMDSWFTEIRTDAGAGRAKHPGLYSVVFSGV